MKLILGDCLEEMKKMPENSVDSIVTDPPYGLSFMGKKWDYDVPSEEIWRECLRVLKPGGHLLAFAGTRTQHRMAVRIEDAGFEIRDMIAWIYGSGFPKSLNIGKAVDKLQGNEREVVGTQMLGGNAAQTTKEKGGTYASNTNAVGVKPIEVKLTKGTSEWEGWGTALKPSLEPITVARKPLSEKTVAENVLTHGTGGINIDGCRIGTEVLPEAKAGQSTIGTFERHDMVTPERIGRFPANLIHDGSEEVVGLFPESKSGARKAGFSNKDKGYEASSYEMRVQWNKDAPAEKGSAARFFYCASGETHDIMSTCKNTNARTVLNFFQTIPLTIGSIVAKSVTENLNDNLAQNVKSAGIVCDSCTTAIAQSLAVMVTENMASQVIQACTTNYGNSIPHQNLAEIVGRWESTDTIPTTASLSQLFGSVLLATDENTSWEKQERGEDGFAQGKGTRFLYQAKASKKDRGDNNHPTVKPTDLMRYLCRLVTPKGGTVLDPFMGSGSTGKAAKLEGFKFIGIEREAEYVEIAKARIECA